MLDSYLFKFGANSLELGSHTSFQYWQEQAAEPTCKVVRAFHTQGLQVIGMPRELVRVLGKAHLSRASQVKFVTAAHFETELGLYLLLVHNQVQLAFKE